MNRQHPLNAANNTRPPEASNRIVQPTGYHAQTRWTSSLSNRLLVEAGFSVQYNKWRREQHDWNTNNSSTYDLSAGTWGGGFWITGWQPEQSQYLKTSMSYVTGSHNFKGGVEHRWGTIGLDQPMNADVRAYYFDDGVPTGLQVLSTPLGNYEGRINFDTGIFAQDSWTLGNWTLNLGTRADFFSSEVPPQQAGAGTWVPARNFPRYAGPRWNTFVARVGVAYDVFGDGRTAIKGTAHQYVSQESTRLALERNPMSSYTWSAASEYRSWDDLDGNRSVVGPDGRVQYEEVGASPNENFGTANDVIGLDLDNREGNWEYNASIQHEVVSGVSASFGWYRRNYHNMWHRDNRLQGPDDFHPFQRTGPRDDRLGQWSGQPLTLYNLNPEVFGQVSKYVTTSDVNDRVYDGFEFVLDGRMSNGAFFGGSFTHERTQLNECDVDEISNPLWRSFALWCDSPRSWQTMYKAHGAYPLPGGIVISTFVQGYPGPNLDANWNVTEMADGTALTEGQRITIDLLPHDRLFLPFQRKVDLRLMRRFNVGNLQLAPVLDIFNFLNANTTTRINSTYGDNWQTIQRIMQARYMRIGMELEW